MEIMNKPMNKQIAAVVVIIIALAAVFILTQSYKTSPTTSPEDKADTDIGKMPDFVMGKVLKVEGQKVFFNVGEEEKSVLVDADTRIIEQVKEQDGYKNVEAKLGNIKIGAQIVVYYQAIIGSEYTAGKIQILPF